MRDESCQPGFGIFIETLEQCDSQCVFDSDITGRVIHQFVSGLDISLRINFVQFVLRSKLVAAAFHFHRVDETGDRNELCLLSVGCVIFGFLHFTRESQFIALGEEYVKVFVMNIQGRASEAITLPFTTMQQAYNLGGQIDVVCFTAKQGVKVSELQPKMEQIIKAAHYIAPNDKQAVMYLNAEAMFSMVDNLFNGINILVWMVGLGTLLAGAIGVSNIMMVTVKERTTEIGIRRAIGARPKDILQQILSESMVLTTIAGMFGISFAVMILQVADMLASSNGGDSHFQVSFGLAVGTCALLAALGMLAGLAPAYRAMAIKPIEAIRDE